MKRLVHQRLDHICLWYDEHRTRQDVFYDFFQYRFRLYKTNRLNFVKDLTSTGMYDFCRGVFNDIGHGQFESRIRVRLTRLHSVFKCDCNRHGNFGFDHVVCLARQGSTILVTRLSSLTRDWPARWWSCLECLTTIVAWQIPTSSPSARPPWVC